MKRITYVIDSDTPHVTEVNTSSSQITEFVFQGEDVTHLKIEEKLFKISHGVCRIDVSALKDGEYTPIAVTDNGTLPLDRMRVVAGDMTLIPGPHEYAKISKTLLNFSKRIKSLEMSVGKLSDAVFGAKLF